MKYKVRYLTSLGIVVQYAAFSTYLIVWRMYEHITYGILCKWMQGVIVMCVKRDIENYGIIYP